MNIDKTIAPSVEALPAVVSNLVCFEPQTESASDRPTWQLDSHWMASGRKLTANFKRLERFTLGAGVTSYALIGEAVTEGDSSLDFVVLMNPCDATVTGAVSSWMLDGLPGCGQESSRAVQVPISDLEACFEMTSATRRVASLMHTEVVTQLVRRGRLHSVLAKQLNLPDSLVCSTVGITF